MTATTAITTATAAPTLPATAPSNPVTSPGIGSATSTITPLNPIASKSMCFRIHAASRTAFALLTKVLLVLATPLIWIQNRCSKSPTVPVTPPTTTPVTTPTTEQREPLAFSKLPLTAEQKIQISYIINTLGTTNCLSVLWYARSLRKAESIIQDVHPLQFLGYIFSQPDLAKNIATLGTGLTTKFQWETFMTQTAQRLNAEDRGVLTRYIREFAESLALDPALITPFFTAADWEGLVGFLVKGKTTRLPPALAATLTPEHKQLIEQAITKFEQVGSLKATFRAPTLKSFWDSVQGASILPLIEEFWINQGARIQKMSPTRRNTLIQEFNKGVTGALSCSQADIDAFCSKLGDKGEQARERIAKQEWGGLVQLLTT